MKILKLVLFALLISSCSAPYINLTIDSYGNYNLNNKTFIIIKGSTVEQDLQFEEFKQRTINVLENKGAKYVENNPDIVIVLNYGMSDAIENISSSSIPVYTNVSKPSSKTGTVDIYDNTITYNEKTHYNNSLELVGYNNVSKSSTSYKRAIVLTAFDKDIIENPNPLWQTLLYSEGSSNDFRILFPIMIISGDDYLGRSSNYKISKKVYLNDELKNKLNQY